MLHRQDKDGLILISQPGHAWLSGQLARAWGNKMFGQVQPAEEVALAAELHDIGFLDWEQAPTLNAKSGLPHSFLELPTDLHLNIWSTGIKQMMRWGRYAALLVSLHYTTLCQRHPIFDQPEEAEMEQEFLDTQRAFQSMLLTSLRNDFHYATYSDEEQITRNRRLLSTWDWMSLLLCMGLSEQPSIQDVPTADGSSGLTLEALKGEALRVKVFPWPFRRDSVGLICEGRRLLKTYADEGQMREALRAASPVTLRIELVTE